MSREIVYAACALRRNLGFTLVVVATLSIGIGLNVAVFSVANSVLFRALPYPQPDRLAWMTNFSLREQRDIFTVNEEYLFWKSQAHSFEGMTGYGDYDVAMVSGGTATQERIAFLAGDFWSITAAKPALGRLFSDRAADEVVLSWPFFQQRFGGNARVIGTSVTLAGHPFRIVGVLSPEFQFAFPQQYIPGDDVRGIDAFIAIPAGILGLPNPVNAATWEEVQRRLGPSRHAVYVIGKLKPGITYEQGRIEMEAIYARYNSQRPAHQREQRLDFAPLPEKLARGERRSLIVLLAAVAFVLLIACANIANLLIAREASRQRETAIRAALGAGKLQLLRLSLFENLLAAMTAAVGGLLLARCFLGLLSGVVLTGGRPLGPVSIDARALVFAVGAALATALLAALGPAVALFRSDFHEILKAGGALSSGGSHRLRGRGFLVAAEIGLAILLLAGAGLMLKSLWRMNQRPDGFDPGNILSMRVTLSGVRYAAWPPKQAYCERVIYRAKAIPGVLAVGVEGGSLNTTVHIGSGAAIGVAIHAVSPGYLRVIGVPLLQGQLPAEDQLFGVVVNEAFARRAGGRVVGQTVTGSILNDAIVGVVPNFKARRLDAEPLPEVYMAYQRFPMNAALRFLLRTARTAETVERPVQQLLAEVDPTQPAYEFESMERALAESVAPRRFQLLLLWVFAATALVLAVIGIHGVIMWSVGQRTREIGIRMSLGASRSGIVLLIVQQGMRLALAGVGGGLLAAVALTRVMASMLYDVKPNDLATFSAVALAMILVALAACCLPALRAGGVDPAITLRGD